MTPKEITMGIGMKTRNDSSNKGTFNQEPKKRANSQRKQDNAQKSLKQSPNQSLKQQQMQSRPRKRASDAQWHSVNNTERNSNRSKRVNPQYKNSQYTDSPYEEEEDFTSQINNNNKSHKKAILIVAVIALITLGCGIFYLMNQVKSANNKTPTNSKLLTKPSEDDGNAEEEEDGDAPEEGTTFDKGFETGDSNSEGGKYEEGTLTKTTPEHYSSSDFLKDLNGYEIPAVYTVQNVTYDVAHVNYQAKRATIDDGMEFYWLEIDYNGKKYRAQCSYNMFRNLESEGICKVAVEILTLDSGQQVVSYMKVVSEDYTVDDAENDFNF